jgi:hypothetical protein
LKIFFARVTNGINKRNSFVFLAEKFIFITIFKKFSMLKLIVDFTAMLIGVEGARLLREKRSTGDPAGLMLEEAPGTSAERERLERKSTDKFNR